MITPVEQGNTSKRGKHHGKRGVSSFTRVAVQRAMDARAAKWGAPEGYYHVEDRAGIISNTAQIWRVRVRLFGGGVHHIEDIVFAKEDGRKDGAVQYRESYQHHLNHGGKQVKLFKLMHRYPTSSLEAAVKWEDPKA